uniref:SFRICE_019370 n=1 Tax=Spodoptera frugiperda TaxID=7108 RepID=A0A2H1VT06_SPOFR
MGRPLVWDATCVDTLAPSHLLSTAACAGAAASAAEDLKRRKYSNLVGSYCFEPFGKAGYFFGQKISIAIQRGNAASLLGTFPNDSDADEYFDA